MIKQTGPSIDDVAAKWAARSLSGEMGPEAQESLDLWLQGDPRRREAYDAYMEVVAIADAAADASAEDALENDLEQFAARSVSRRSWLVAAPAMAASLAGAALFFNMMMGGEDEPLRYASQRGEVLDVNLEDGSVVTLNTNTEIEVRFDKRRRNIRLVKGEALFDVMRDTGRPFVVATMRAEATVLGTRFNIYEKAEETVISVLSGVVEVGSASKAQSDAAVMLIAGREVSVADSGELDQAREFKPDAVTSWRRGLAYFESEPLSAVVEDLNRYYPVRLVVDDAALSEMRVTGGFDLQDQAVAIEALSAALSLRAERRSDGAIYLLADG